MQARRAPSGCVGLAIHCSHWMDAGGLRRCSQLQSRPHAGGWSSHGLQTFQEAWGGGGGDMLSLLVKGAPHGACHPEEGLCENRPGLWRKSSHLTALTDSELLDSPSFLGSRSRNSHQPSPHPTSLSRLTLTFVSPESSGQWVLKGEPTDIFFKLSINRNISMCRNKRNTGNMVSWPRQCQGGPA